MSLERLTGWLLAFAAVVSGVTVVANLVVADWVGAAAGAAVLAPTMVALDYRRRLHEVYRSLP